MDNEELEVEELAEVDDDDEEIVEPPKKTKVEPRELNKGETNRLVECLFYLYFSDRDLSETGTTEFWAMVRNVCNIYSINNLLIVNALRTLMDHKNKPTDEEMMYLFTGTKLSVRDINGISKIYWKRQKEFIEKFDTGYKPTIYPRINDVLAQKAMRKFIEAVYSIAGIFRIIDRKFLDDVLR